MIDNPAVAPAVNVRQTPRTKRVADLVISICAIVFLAPLLLAIALLIRLDSRGSVFFTQVRVGRGGSRFKMYKFRTMVVDAEEQLEELTDANEGGDQLIRIPNDPRVTRVGRWLRPLGLDELPQLINVVRGEMSVIGPWPQSPSEVALYDDRQRRRLEVLPGITGLWQVTSRADPSFEEWVRCDLEYIDHWSLLLDLRIALKTPLAALRALLGVQPTTDAASSAPKSTAPTPGPIDGSDN